MSDIEVFAMLTPPEDVRRQQWVVWLDTVRRVAHAGGFTPAGLEYVRKELRRGIWTAERVPESHRSQHAVILNDITELIVAARPDMRDYFVGAGDLYPSAPDDLSTLSAP